MRTRVLMPMVAENCCMYVVESFYITVADWMPYSCWDLAHHWHLTESAHIAASGVMHHATTAVLWLQCAAAFILLYVRVWANVMPCGHQNSNLSLSQGCNEPLMATGWVFDDAQGHKPGWELEFWCQNFTVLFLCSLWPKPQNLCRHNFRKKNLCSYHILKVTTFGPLFLIYRASSMIFNFLMLTLTKALELLSIPYLDRELLQKLYSLTTELLVNGPKKGPELKFLCLVWPKPQNLCRRNILYMVDEATIY